MNYYFCDICHYCFEAESLPDRCPDCGKVKFQDRAAVRPASEAEIAEIKKIQQEENSLSLSGKNK